MDITSFVVGGRDGALLYGGYSTYHSQLAKRLANSRRKLGIATKNRGKFQKRQVSSQDIAENNEYVHLLLLTSERAWAQAMSAKSAHSSGQSEMTRKTRSHIVSRLDKAARTAQHLAQLLAETEAQATDLLEAKAYAALLRGTMLFERRSWEPCLQSYATARIAYSALAGSGNSDVFKDLLSETIDPSIRYAAYQLKTPRTIPIATITKRAFPRSDDALVRQIDEMDPSLLADSADGSAASGTPGAPSTLTWRSREIQMEDAQISIAWASVAAAKSRLAETLAEPTPREPREEAAAYDELLTATQEAVDATKQAMDELKSEGVSQSDARMQRLQMTRTAVNYEMISWRIGRNRVLTGKQDGAPEDYGPVKKRKAKKMLAAGKKPELRRNEKLAKLKEQVALYDGIMGSLESIKELPGIAADEALTTRIDAYSKYFESLRCLAIARSHSIKEVLVNTLALVNHAYKLCTEAVAMLSKSSDDDKDAGTKPPLGIDVSSSALSSLHQFLTGELLRHRALVHLENLQRKEAEKAEHYVPLIERMHEYPKGGVDLDRIVDWPPKMESIPIPPIFLDIAFNYIDYPGRKKDDTDEASASTSAAGAGAGAGQSAEGGEAGSAPPPPKKKGWFSFGR